MSWFISRDRDAFTWPDLGDVSDAIDEVPVGLLLPAVQKIRSAFNEPDPDIIPELDVEFGFDPEPVTVVLEYFVLA